MADATPGRLFPLEIKNYGRLHKHGSECCARPHPVFFQSTLNSFRVSHHLGDGPVPEG